MLAALLLCGLGGPRAAGIARAAGDEAAPPVAGAPLLWRRYDVSALTQARPLFFPEWVPDPPIVDAEIALLSSGKPWPTTEPAFVGSVADLIELVRSDLPPDRLQSTNSTIGVEPGGAIYLRGPQDLHAAVAAHLERLARQLLVPIVIDVVAVRQVGAIQAAGGVGGVPEAVRGGSLRVLGAARATGLLDERVVCRAGGQQAYLADQDVEVAKEARTPDPIVEIAQDGIGLDATVLEATRERVRLRLDAWLALPGPVRVRKAVDDDPVETLETETRGTAAVLDLVPGVWTLLQSTGDVLFAVRATPQPADLTAGRPLPSVPVLLHAAQGALVSRSFELGDLATLPRVIPSPPLRLFWSNYLPPVPRDESPVEVWSDSLVDAVKQRVDRDGWDDEGSEIHLRTGRLTVRHDERHQEAVAAFLDGLQAYLRASWRVRLDAVQLPLASLPEWWTGLGTGEGLLKDGTGVLLSRAGARAIDAASVRLQRGLRNATIGGTNHTYLADYDLEIAEKSTIGNPIIRQVLAGLSVEVDACPVLDAGALLCNARIERSTWRGLRTVWTRSGSIECPSLGRQVWNGSAVIPIGATRIVAAGRRRRHDHAVPPDGECP